MSKKTNAAILIIGNEILSEELKIQIQALYHYG